MNIPEPVPNFELFSLTLNIPQSESHLIDYIGVVSGCLVVLAPAAIDQLQLSTSNQFLDNGFCLLRLIRPPFGEVNHFNIHVLAILVQLQLVDHVRDDLLHMGIIVTGFKFGNMSPPKVLFRRFQISGIVMRIFLSNPIVLS